MSLAFSFFVLIFFPLAPLLVTEVLAGSADHCVTVRWTRELGCTYGGADGSRIAEFTNQCNMNLRIRYTDNSYGRESNPGSFWLEPGQSSDVLVQCYHGTPSINYNAEPWQ